MRYFIIISLLCFLGDTSYACECLGCPPVSTKVNIFLKDGKQIKGNIRTYAIHSSVFDLEEFNPNINLCGYKVFKNQIKVWQTIPTPNYKSMDAYSFKAEFSRAPNSNLVKRVLISQGKTKVYLPQAVVHIGKPKIIDTANVVKIKRLSDAISPIFYISEQNRKYISRKPKLITYVEDATEVMTECWVFSYAKLFKPAELDKYCRKNMHKEGIIMFFRHDPT